MDRAQLSSLVIAAQGGDDRAFTTLVRGFQDVAVAYATGILRDYHLAEDAAQEAFVEAHRALSALREPAAFGAWLRTIIVKHCDRLTRRPQHPLTALEAAVDVASPEPSPHDALEAQETRRSLRAAIGQLSDAEQQVVLLYYMGDQPHAEIAEFLDISANAVKTRLYSARRRLRQHMDEIEQHLRATRPSSDPAFADRIRRLIRPDALARNEPLRWSPGMGADIWEMFCACITGDVATIERLLARDASLIQCAFDYRRPLAFAVRENQLEVARLLLARGASPISSGTPDTLVEIARDRGHREMEALLERALAGGDGVSPEAAAVGTAIRARDLTAVRRLLDGKPALVHAPDEGTNQPIHWAVMTRQLDMIDEVLERGANIDAQRADGARPVQLTNGDYGYRGWRDVPKDIVTTPRDVLAHLRARGASVDICTASYIGDLARVRELLAADPSLANRPSDYVAYYPCSGTPLRNAAEAGHADIVRELLAHGADPNLPEPDIAPRGHALHSAVCNGHIEIARLLLDHGAYPSVEIESSGDTLSAAMWRGDQPMIELLCSYGAARTIRLLAYSGDVQTTAAVFNANPALADDPQVLEIAAGQGHESIVRLMLRYQPTLAERIAVGVRSQGPQDAIKTRALTELLFERGMKASQPDWLRITPLHRFAQRGDVENATIFLDHGADIHARDEELRSTPLGWAAKYGQVAMVELLLSRGAKAGLPDDPPWATPLAWATRRGHTEVAALLSRG